MDDDPSLLEALERALRDAGEEVVAHGSFEDARRALRTTAFDALITCPAGRLQRPAAGGHGAGHAPGNPRDCVFGIR